MQQTRVPTGFLRRGLRLAISRAYFAQQLDLTRQQAPPQQSAERDVAFAVPTSARTATIISRHFIEFLLLNFLLLVRRGGRAGAATDQARGGGTGGRCERTWSRMERVAKDSSPVGG